jgi:hypothetical protein
MGCDCVAEWRLQCACATPLFSFCVMIAPPAPQVYRPDADVVYDLPKAVQKNEEVDMDNDTDRHLPLMTRADHAVLQREIDTTTNADLAREAAELSQLRASVRRARALMQATYTTTARRLPKPVPIAGFSRVTRWCAG